MSMFRRMLLIKKILEAGYPLFIEVSPGVLNLLPTGKKVKTFLKDNEVFLYGEKS